MPPVFKSKMKHPVTGGRAVLELTVANHPGVMSHVSGLFSRRAFNVEAILCLPIGDGRRSRIWLLVNEDARLEQMIRQLWKLEDIFDIHRRAGGHREFDRLEEFFAGIDQPVLSGD